MVNIIGTGGRGNDGICSGSCPSQSQFAKLCGSNGDIGIFQTSGCRNDYGFLLFTVNTSKLTADWVSASCNLSPAPCILTDHYEISVPAAGDFSVSSNIVRVSRGTVGGPGAYSSVGTVSANSFGGFSGTVSLSVGSVSGGPTGTCPGSSCPGATLDTTSLTLTPGSTAYTILKFSNTLNTPCSNPDNSPGAARYAVIVTAASGSTSRQYTILVYIYGRGDVVKDGTVNILDIATLDLIYDSVSGQPNFDPNMDVNNNGHIDIVDAATVAFLYGGTGC